jgi:hypothetical protein
LPQSRHGPDAQSVWQALPTEVVAQIVPDRWSALFVEEVTKTVLESGLLQEQEGTAIA